MSVKPSNNYRTLTSDIIIFLIGTVLAKAIQFFLMPVYTSYMSTEAYGVAELTNNLSELFFPIATLCIYEAAFRFAVDPNFDDSRLATAILKVMSISAAIGLIITTIARAVFGYTNAFYLFFVLYAYSIRMCAAYYVRGSGKSRIFATSGIVNALFLSIFSVLFLIPLKMGESGYLLSIGLSYVASAVYLIRRAGIIKKIDLKFDSHSDLKVLFKYCLPLITYNVLYWFTTISGRYILLHYSGSSTAGKYVASIKIAAIINMIQQAVYAAFQLNSSRMYSERDKENFYSSIINLFVAIYCAFGALIVLATPLLAKITLKNEFYTARVYLPIIMLAAIINCISSLVGTMYSTYKRTQRMVMVSVIGALINIIFSVLLVPQYDIWGVCIASVLCYLSQTVYKFFDVRKFCEIKYSLEIIIPNILLLVVQVVIMSADLQYKYSIATILVVCLFGLNIKVFKTGIKELLGNKTIKFGKRD